VGKQGDKRQIVSGYSNNFYSLGNVVYKLVDLAPGDGRMTITKGSPGDAKAATNQKG
jgi:hypothetical protein